MLALSRLSLSSDSWAHTSSSSWDNGREKHMLKQPQQASSLELSPSFWPAACAVEEGFPTHFSACSRVTISLQYIRVHQCYAFYRAPCRTWKRLSITVTTSVKSPYWNIGKTAAMSSLWTGPVLLDEVRFNLQTFSNGCQSVH